MRFTEHFMPCPHKTAAKVIKINPKNKLKMPLFFILFLITFLCGYFKEIDLLFYISLTIFAISQIEYYE